MKGAPKEESTYVPFVEALMFVPLLVATKRTHVSGTIVLFVVFVAFPPAAIVTLVVFIV